MNSVNEELPNTCNFQPQAMRQLTLKCALICLGQNVRAPVLFSKIRYLHAIKIGVLDLQKNVHCVHACDVHKQCDFSESWEGSNRFSSSGTV